MNLTGQMKVLTDYGRIEILNGTFSKFYNPSENLVIDKVIVSFKGKVIFKQNIPKKRKAIRHQNFHTL